MPIHETTDLGRRMIRRSQVHRWGDVHCLGLAPAPRPRRRRVRRPARPDRGGWRAGQRPGAVRAAFTCAAGPADRGRGWAGGSPTAGPRAGAGYRGALRRPSKALVSWEVRGVHGGRDRGDGGDHGGVECRCPGPGGGQPQAQSSGGTLDPAGDRERGTRCDSPLDRPMRGGVPSGLARASGMWTATSGWHRVAVDDPAGRWDGGYRPGHGPLSLRCDACEVRGRVLRTIGGDLAEIVAALCALPTTRPASACAGSAPTSASAGPL